MKIRKLLSLLLLPLAFTACKDDEVSSTSVLQADPVENTDLQNWVSRNYTDPYNINFLYRYIDSQTDRQYNVIPTDTANAKAMAILIKHVWIDAYNEVMNDGGVFMKQNAPRIIQLLGSFQYKSSGERTLGVAEGGLKVTLFGCNQFDVAHPHIDQDSPYPHTESSPMDLNYWFFHTMHHEFCHILTQKKNYSTDFQKVSAKYQKLTDWVNLEDSIAPAYGFPSGYASSEYNEDFAEIYSIYVTHTPEAWAQIVADTKRTHQWEGDKKVEITDRSLTATADLESKVSMLRTYFKDNWGLDIDKLRDVVLRRSKEALEKDLTKLPND